MPKSLRNGTEGKLQMLLSLTENGLTSLVKEVRVFKVWDSEEPELRPTHGGCHSTWWQQRGKNKMMYTTTRAEHKLNGHLKKGRGTKDGHGAYAIPLPRRVCAFDPASSRL